MTDPGRWNLERVDGRLVMDGLALVELADTHGSPLHLVSAARLRARAREWTEAFSAYAKPVRSHFSYKTNPVAGVLQVLHREGLGAEVTCGYELWLSQKLGVRPADVVFNGPNKSDDELTDAVRQEIGLLVIDGVAELERTLRIADELERDVSIALRICPDVVPKGMNSSSVTGSRKNQFGMDLGSAELAECIRSAVGHPRARVRGIHAHIGSGIHDLAAFATAAERVLEVQAALFAAGAHPDLIDLGGGLGTTLSREFTSIEMLAYLGIGKLPKERFPSEHDLLPRYARAIGQAIEKGCRRLGIEVPVLVLEPGRALVSDAQVLLLRVGAVRSRPGVGRFAIADGGAMTVSMMFLSECHAVLLANREAEIDGKTCVFGRLPSPMDVVYRNLPMPQLEVGDTLAIMDAGAYFTSTATNFGGPRPAVVLVEDGRAQLVRRRESYEDLARVEVPLGLD